MSDMRDYDHRCRACGAPPEQWCLGTCKRGQTNLALGGAAICDGCRARDAEWLAMRNRAFAAESRVAVLEAALQTARAALDKGTALASAMHDVGYNTNETKRDAAEQTAYDILDEMEAASQAIDALGLGE